MVKSKHWRLCVKSHDCHIFASPTWSRWRGGAIGSAQGGRDDASCFTECKWSFGQPERFVRKDWWENVGCHDISWLIMADYCRRWYQGFGKRFWEQSEWGRVWGMAVLKAKRRMHGNSIQPHGTRLSLGPCRPRSLSDSRGVQWLAGPSGGPNAAGILAHWQHLDEGREDAAWSESFSDMVMKFLSLLDYVVHGKPLELFFPTQHVTLDVTLGLTKDNDIIDKNISNFKDHCEQIKFQNDMFGKDLFQSTFTPHLRATDGGDVKSGAWITFFAWKMWYVSVECGIAIGSLVEFFSSALFSPCNIRHLTFGCRLTQIFNEEVMIHCYLSHQWCKSNAYFQWSGLRKWSIYIT